MKSQDKDPQASSVKSWSEHLLSIWFLPSPVFVKSPFERMSPICLDALPATELHHVHTPSSSRHWPHRSKILSACGGRISNCVNSGTWTEWTLFAARLLLPTYLHKVAQTTLTHSRYPERRERLGQRWRRQPRQWRRRLCVGNGSGLISSTPQAL